MTPEKLFSSFPTALFQRHRHDVRARRQLRDHNLNYRIIWLSSLLICRLVSKNILLTLIFSIYPLNRELILLLLFQNLISLYLPHDLLLVMVKSFSSPFSLALNLSLLIPLVIVAINFRSFLIALLHR